MFEVRATHIEELVAIEGSAKGDLEGVGRWHFSRKGQVSSVHYEWHVRSTKRWMNLVAPFVRPAFIHNHEYIMSHGGEGLARLLNSRLLSQENIDLMAKESRPRALPGTLHEGGWINPLMLLIVGLSAGAVATLVQLALWWLAEVPVLETLFRDATTDCRTGDGTGCSATTVDGATGHPPGCHIDPFCLVRALCLCSRVSGWPPPWLGGAGCRRPLRPDDICGQSLWIDDAVSLVQRCP